MTRALDIYVHIREKWGRMAETMVERFRLRDHRKDMRTVPLEQVTPEDLAVDPFLIVQLPQPQSERIRNLEEHGPAALQ